MKTFLRGIVCYITFVVYVIGFSFYLITSLVGEDELKIAGIILLIIGLVLSIIESRFYPKGKRARCAVFFVVNGLIIFLYMSILFAPIGKMLSTMLEAQHGDFFDWKYGMIWNQSEERLAMKKPAKIIVDKTIDNSNESIFSYGSNDDTPEYLRSPGTNNSYRFETSIGASNKESEYTTKYIVDDNGNWKVVRKTSYGRYIDDDGNEYM
jgi:hypothetical protein